MSACIQFETNYCAHSFTQSTPAAYCHKLPIFILFYFLWYFTAILRSIPIFFCCSYAKLITFSVRLCLVWHIHSFVHSFTVRVCLWQTVYLMVFAIHRVSARARVCAFPIILWWCLMKDLNAINSKVLILKGPDGAWKKSSHFSMRISLSDWFKYSLQSKGGRIRFNVLFV